MTGANATPAALGYRWPAEWEPHAATWLAWPHNRETWPGKFDRIPSVFAELVRTIANLEPVNILAGGAAVLPDAESFVGNLANVTLYDIPTNDAWTRDHGPTFVTRPNDAAALVDWQYNAWGQKYPPFDRDNAVPKAIADELQRRRFASPIVLEGGAIEGNGNGVVLTTKSCLPNENRNPNQTLDAIQKHLADNVAARQVHWLGVAAIAGDDTDGHIDQLARFVNPTTIVAAVEEDPADANYESLQQNYRQLCELAGEHGQPFDVVTIPMPRPLYHRDQRLPASYANFYVFNGGVIVPTFNDPADDEAAATLAGLFPDREILQLPSAELVCGLGSFHCLTQQEPMTRSDVVAQR